MGWPFSLSGTQPEWIHSGQLRLTLRVGAGAASATKMPPQNLFIYLLINKVGTVSLLFPNNRSSSTDPLGNPRLEGISGMGRGPHPVGPNTLLKRKAWPRRGFLGLKAEGFTCSRYGILGQGKGQPGAWLAGEFQKS